MTVTVQTPTISYTGNGATTVFAYPFKIVAAADLKVIVGGAVQTLTSHYSVSGVGADAGGNVTFVTAPANGATVVIARDMDFARATDYQDNGDLLADILNADQDAPILMIQQLAQSLSDSKVLRLDAAVVDTAAPLNQSAASRANKFLAFDGSGNLAIASGTGADAGLRADLASVSVNQGAAMVGVNDAAGLFGAVNVEAALGEAMTRARDWIKAADIASAATTNIGTVLGNNHAVITGTTTINSFGTAVQAGIVRILRFAGALTLTHGANLILPGAQNLTTQAGDVIIVIADSATVWRVLHVQRAQGTLLFKSAGSIAAASTTDLSASNGNFVEVTSSTLTTINSFGTADAGEVRFVLFTVTANNLFVANSANIVMPGAQTLRMQSGDWMILISLGGGSWTVANFHPNEAPVAGQIVQTIFTQDTTASSGTATIPYDDTFPQNTEGTEYTQIATSITPRYPNSLMRVRFHLPTWGVSGSQPIFALFRDSAANAIKAALWYPVATNDPVSPIQLEALVAGPFTVGVPTTFKIRYGCRAAATVFINQVSAGAARFLTADGAIMTIEEIRQ